MDKRFRVPIHQLKIAVLILIALTLISINVPSTSAATPKTKNQANYLRRSTPVHISIPAIGVEAGFIKLGLNQAGGLDVPKTGQVAGWYTGAPTPGELGPAIIAAHVDMNGKVGIFFHLKDLRKGDRIEIRRADHKIVKFVVTETDTFSKSHFPTSKVYGDINFAGLRLITCGGKFDSKSHHYEFNIVVFAKMIS